jgi:hypothetical protein
MSNVNCLHELGQKDTLTGMYRSRIVGQQREVMVA